MKKSIRMLCALMAVLMVSALAGCKDKEEKENVVVPDIEGYELLWHDEFSEDKLDMTIWDYDPHEPGWTNEELQEYTTSEKNVFTRDGKLVLKAIKTEDANGKPYYTSGKVKTQNKKDFMYGKIVASAKVPKGYGLWPAIWMMPTDEQHYGQWPKCGEIDIMEVLGNDPTTAYGTLHYGEPHADQQAIYKLEEGSFADDFHEFSVEWDPGEFRYYIDGELYLTINDWFTAVQGEDDKPYPAPFDQTFFVQLNLAVGGTWPGNPTPTTNFDKAEFQIDYVRVYQRSEYDTNVTKPTKTFREPLADGNYINNGDFSEKEDLYDEKDWQFLLFNGGDGSAKIEDNTVIIETKAEGTEDYSVQLLQAEMPIIKGKSYRATFDAWADEERDMIVCVSAPNAGWIRYLPDTKFKVGTKKKTYTFEFDMTEKDDNTARFEFNMGHCGSTSTIYIQNVRLEEITK